MFVFIIYDWRWWSIWDSNPSDVLLARQVATPSSPIPHISREAYHIRRIRYTDISVWRPYGELNPALMRDSHLCEPIHHKAIFAIDAASIQLYRCFCKVRIAEDHLRVFQRLVMLGESWVFSFTWPRRWDSNPHNIRETVGAISQFWYGAIYF